MRLLTKVIILTAALAVISCSAPAWARVYIDITQPFSRKLPIALPVFQPLDGAAADAVGADGARILQKNLSFTGLFDFLNPKGFLGLPKIGAVQYRRWSVIGAELLVACEYKRQGDELTLHCSLYDVVEGKRLVGVEYGGTMAMLPDMMDRFADEIMHAVTGERSVFSTMIAFVSTKSGHKEIMVMRYDGSGVKAVTNRGDICLYPAWSRDGQLLAYTSYVRRRPVVLLHSLRGGSGRVAVNKPGVNITPAFQPGSGNLAVAMSHTGKTNIFLMDQTGRELKRLTNGWGIEVDPSFSPDGRKMAFVSDRGGSPQIYILDLASGQVQRLTYGLKYSAAPAWSPKGDLIAFQAEINGVFQICTIRTDGSDTRVLTSGLSACEEPTWSPDGRLIAYAGRRTGRYQIYVITYEGQPIKRLTSLPGDQTAPAWSPPGVVK